MKKYLIILFLIITSKTYSQLKPLVELEVGYKNMSAKIGQENKWFAANVYRYNMYSNFLVGAKSKKIELGTNIENYFGYDNGTSFTPKQITYNLFFKYTLKSFTITYEHFCSHPIISKVSDVYISNDSYYTNSYDKLTIKYKLL